jgi:DHA2 family multidrug resistance protein
MRLREHVSWSNPAAVEQMNNMAANYAAHGLDGAAIAIKQMVGLVERQAMIMSFSDVFMFLTVLFACMLACVVMIKKPGAPAGGGGGGH